MLRQLNHGWAFRVELDFDDEVRDVLGRDSVNEVVRRQLHGEGGIAKELDELEYFMPALGEADDDSLLRSE